MSQNDFVHIDVLVELIIIHTYNVFIANELVVLLIILPPDPGTTTDSACSLGMTRLVSSDTTNPLEGRVEVCINRAWGTVCAEGFNDVDAQVVCNSINGTGMFSIWLKYQFIGVYYSLRS